MAKKTQAYITFCKHLQSALLADESNHESIVENTLIEEIGVILSSIEEKYEKIPENLREEIDFIDNLLI